MGSLIELSGKTFGRLTVLGRAPSKKGHTHWLARCVCGTVKSVSAHNLGHPDPTRRIVSCGCYGREARVAATTKHGESKSPRMKMYWGAKKRAKERGQIFTIKPTDIVIPDICPLLGIPLQITGRVQSANSPSLDRIDSRRGYEAGNVQVISNRANTMKHDASFEEFELLYLNWKRQQAVGGE